MQLKLAALPALLFIGACSPQSDAPVSDAAVRLPAVQGNPGAAYFTLHGGEKGRTLIAVASPDAGRADMHDMVMKNGMMIMTPVTSVVVPKQSDVRFETGGKHVMLYDLKSGLKPGDSINLSFTFQDGETVQLVATAQAAGGSEPHGH